MLAMVTSKETRAAIIALPQNGLTCKEIAIKNIAPERTIYLIIKNFKAQGLSEPIAKLMKNKDQHCKY